MLWIFIIRSKITMVFDLQIVEGLSQAWMKLKYGIILRVGIIIHREDCPWFLQPNNLNIKSHHIFWESKNGIKKRTSWRSIKEKTFVVQYTSFSQIFEETHKYIKLFFTGGEQNMLCGLTELVHWTNDNAVLFWPSEKHSP